MGFKMKGFNPGKGTGMGSSAFKRDAPPSYVVNSDGSIFYPPPPEEKEFVNYGDNLTVSPRSYSVTTEQTETATNRPANTDDRHNEATYVIRNESTGYDEYTQGFRTKENEQNEILYNELKPQIKEYNEDIFSIPIDSNDFHINNENYYSGLNNFFEEKQSDLIKEFSPEISGLKRTMSKPRDNWTNADLKTYNDFRRKVQGLYNEKVDESRSLYNDISLIHERGYDTENLGLNESSFGITGEPKINEHRLYVNNINNQLLEQGKINRQAKQSRDKYFEAIEKGNIAAMENQVRKLKKQDPEFLATQPYWKMMDDQSGKANRHYKRLNKYLRKNPNVDVNTAMQNLGIAKFYVTDLTGVERVDYNDSGDEVLTKEDNYVYPYENEMSDSDRAMLDTMDKEIINEEVSSQTEEYQPQSVAIKEKENLENEIKAKEDMTSDDDNDGVPNHLENNNQEETGEIATSEEPEVTGIGDDRRFRKEYIPQTTRT